MKFHDFCWDFQKSHNFSREFLDFSKISWFPVKITEIAGFVYEIWAFGGPSEPLIMIFAWEVLHFWENNVFPFRSRSGGFFSVISSNFPQFLVDFGVFFLHFGPQNTLLGPPGRLFLGVRKFVVSGLGFFKHPGHVSRAFWAFWGRPGGSGTVFWRIFRA